MISGSRVFADVVTASSGINVDQSTVITSSGTVSISALPVATANSLGVVKPGYGLTTDASGTLSVVGGGAVSLAKQVFTVGDNSASTFNITGSSTGPIYVDLTLPATAAKQDFVIPANISSGWTRTTTAKFDGMNNRLYIYKDSAETGFASSGDTAAWNGFTLVIKI